MDFGDDAQSDVSMVLSGLKPLSRLHSPVDMSSDSQIVVESLCDAPAEPLAVSTVVDGVAQLSQVSGLSLVQLSPNRVCEDFFTYSSLDVFPLFQVSPEAEGNIGYVTGYATESPKLTKITGHTGSWLFTAGGDRVARQLRWESGDVYAPCRTCGRLIYVAGSLDFASGRNAASADPDATTVVPETSITGGIACFG